MRMVGYYIIIRAIRDIQLGVNVTKTLNETWLKPAAILEPPAGTDPSGIILLLLILYSLLISYPTQAASDGVER